MIIANFNGTQNDKRHYKITHTSNANRYTFSIGNKYRFSNNMSNVPSRFIGTLVLCGRGSGGKRIGPPLLKSYYVLNRILNILVGSVWRVELFWEHWDISCCSDLVVSNIKIRIKISEFSY